MNASTAPFRYAVVLTGGIATGKSTVAAMFAQDGYAIIDADRVAHEVLEREREQIAQLFGEEVIQAGRVDRKALGAIVFADATQRQRLEALLHPLIRQEITAQARELDTTQQTYIVDIPLFFERKGYPIARSIVVYAPKSVQLTRLMQRDGYNTTEALSRIEAQMSIEEKRQLATCVIDNSTTMEALQHAYRSCREYLEKGEA